MLFLLETASYALPIGFGYNQGPLEFQELTTEDFTLYHDARTPRDGKLALNALIAARPHMERWFQTSRTSPLIVNMSAQSDNASFANFLTDSIELQTMGQGSRDLVWHEYTHATMYRHLDNFLGPAGAIIHLPWMEAWFLEGLAEALSVSIGSEQQASIERYQALNNDWPSWDRIHSLYTAGPFSYRGYATSGAFVAWMLRTYDAGKLAAALKSFRDDTMPWMWPWALTPFNQFWPMDTMLREWTGLSGKELYERYQASAREHWLKASPTPQMVTTNHSFRKVTSANGVQFLHNKLWSTARDGHDFVLQDFVEKGRGSKESQTSKTIAASSDIASHNIAVDGDAVAYISLHFPQANTQATAVVSKTPAQTITIPRRATWIQDIWFSKTHLWWLENELETTRVCRVPRGSQTPIDCPLEFSLPHTLTSLGAERETSGTMNKIWLAKTTQTVKGDLHSIVTIDAVDQSIKEFQWKDGGRPLSAAIQSQNIWLLIGDRQARHLRRFDRNGQCVESIPLSDFALKLVAASDQRPWIASWRGDTQTLAYPTAAIHPSESCRFLDDHTSPLIEAIRSDRTLDLNTAMINADPWRSKAESQSQVKLTPATLDAEASVDGVHPTENQSSPRTWRGRPVFAFPWIGADDALGPQLGIISVPLMDHLQNETLRATVLVGLYSRFPYQELALMENRWSPTWTFAVYRSQLYNGRYYSDEARTELLSSYLDEKGGRIDGDYTQRWKSTAINWSWGLRAGHLAPYIGNAYHTGQFKELYAGIAYRWHMTENWRLLLSSQNKWASKSWAQEFDYHVIGGSASVGRSVHNGQVELGVEGEATRGTHRRDLQEMYMPLKTFVPGSGGGYNKNSYALTTDYGLFSPRFGDTQARAKLNATHPLIDDFDKFMGLIYIDRLDFSAFLNHGGVWSGGSAPSGSKLLTSHGYNVDLLMDNKGVRFNVGSGVGQVIGQRWQLYMTAGFDALF